MYTSPLTGSTRLQTHDKEHSLLGPIPQNVLVHKVPSTIRATTVRTGEDWSPNLKVEGTNNFWSPKFLAVVFKKQEISQKVPECSSSSSNSISSRNEYLGGIIALLLQDHRTMSIKSVCSSQYMVTDQH